MWGNVVLVRAKVLEKRIPSIMLLRRIGEIGTMLAVTSNHAYASVGSY
jgi:hypothetical protein